MKALQTSAELEIVTNTDPRPNSDEEPPTNNHVSTASKSNLKELITVFYASPHC
jgi:hypothetical protein